MIVEGKYLFQRLKGVSKEKARDVAIGRYVGEYGEDYSEIFKTVEDFVAAYNAKVESAIEEVKADTDISERT